uniref:Uncharacterized protein n=1 Tax=Anguilla anguilla TaxID=7936 RepID=A0A0E9P7J0_ANGAN
MFINSADAKLSRWGLQQRARKSLTKISINSDSLLQLKSCINCLTQRCTDHTRHACCT